MPRFLVAIHRPHGYDPAVAEDDTMRAEIHALNREMVAAGVRAFVCGLQSPAKARALRADDGGGVTVTEGLYLDADEHMGGFWVLDVADLEEALAWARKAVVACRAGVEVRPLH